jgi:hypothetical protein
LAIGDYDNDGDLDIFVVSRGSTSALLYRNEGNMKFLDVARQEGIVDSTGYVAAWGDIDNDGDLDLFLTQAARTPNRLFLNQKGQENNWLIVRTVGVQSNRAGIGARVRCVSGNLSQIREVDGGSGCFSQPMLPVHFGLGGRTTIDSLIIRWPSGTVDVYSHLKVNHYITVTEGKGITVGVGNGEKEMPAAFELFQNYPNPFNPSTSITFRLSRFAFVSVKVYDVLGREVATLVNEWKEAGTYNIQFDIRPDPASAGGSFDIFSSGVYFYRLIATPAGKHSSDFIPSTTYIETKKMMLLH